MKSSKSPSNFLKKVPTDNHRQLTDEDKKILEKRLKEYEENVNKSGIAIIPDDFTNE